MRNRSDPTGSFNAAPLTDGTGPPNPACNRANAKFAQGFGSCFKKRTKKQALLFEKKKQKLFSVRSAVQGCGSNRGALRT
jgi:hypothetical protein